MKKWMGMMVAAGAMGLAACQSSAGLVGRPASAEDALEAYYRTLPYSFYPRAGAGKAMPAADAALTRILVGSCLDEEKPESVALKTLQGERADLFLMIGDNVYGDRDGTAYNANEAELDELRESFADLAARADFKAVREAHPMMVAWDDHDYGANDAGREFPFRRLAERIHENFWGLDKEDAGQRPGTYYARTFGPEGKRTQVIVLDTRFFRSGLTATDTPNAKGKERYVPSTAPDQDMLGDAQWAWLEAELKKPADVRLIVSSIQVMTTNGHGWEAWSRLPAEQARLYKLIQTTGAKGAVFVSGDRHTAFLYRKDGILPYPARELTASSMNVSFAKVSEERDAAQLGDGYPEENYGALDIDWTANTIRMQIKSNTGQTVREDVFRFR